MASSGPARIAPPRLGALPRRRLHEDIAERLRDAILDGEFRPGDRLPPERELAQSFGVNRGSVREAIKVLEGLGLLRVRQGDGAIVQPLVHGSLALLGPLVYRRGRVDLQGLGDLLEVAAPLLRELARTAIRRGQPDAIARLDDLRARMADATLPREDRLAASREMLVVIADATGNRVWQIIARQMRGLLESPPLVEARSRLRRDPAELAAALAACLDALRAGDRAQAEAAAGELIRRLTASILESARRAAGQATPDEEDSR